MTFDHDGPRGGGISKRGRGNKYNNKNIHIVLPEEDEGMGGGDRQEEQAGRARLPYIRSAMGARYCCNKKPSCR